MTFETIARKIVAPYFEAECRDIDEDLVKRISAALGSRVVLPERKEEIELRPDMIFLERAKAWSNEGFNECLDQIKLVPLSVDEILPSDEELDSLIEKEFEKYNKEGSELLYQFMVSMRKAEWKAFAKIIRESIKKRLGAV